MNADINKMIESHIEYSDATKKFNGSGDWARARDHIAELQAQVDGYKEFASRVCAGDTGNQLLLKKILGYK